MKNLKSLSGLTSIALLGGILGCPAAPMDESESTVPVDGSIVETTPEEEAANDEMGTRLEQVNEESVPEPADAENQYEGTVVKVEEAALIVKNEAGEENDFAVQPDAKVMRGEEAVQMSQLKPGQKVVVTARRDGDSQDGVIEVVTRINIVD